MIRIYVIDLGSLVLYIGNVIPHVLQRDPCGNNCCAYLDVEDFDSDIQKISSLSPENGWMKGHYWQKVLWV
jgi:hypothetical protein